MVAICICYAFSFVAFVFAAVLANNRCMYKTNFPVHAAVLQSHRPCRMSWSLQKPSVYGGIAETQADIQVKQRAVVG